MPARGAAVVLNAGAAPGVCPSPWAPCGPLVGGNHGAAPARTLSGARSGATYPPALLLVLPAPCMGRTAPHQS